MKLKEKLELFSRAAIQDASEKYAKMIEEIENEFNSTVAEEENRARRKAEDELRAEKYKADQTRHRLTLNASSECKRGLIEHRSKLMDELFEEVRERLEAFVKTPEYKEYLFEQLKLRTAGYSNIEIKLNSGDMQYAGEIKKLTGAVVTEANEDFIGGFKMILVEKRAVYDATFASRLSDEKKGFNKFKASI